MGAFLRNASLPFQSTSVVHRLTPDGARGSFPAMDAGKPSLHALAELEGVILELDRQRTALPQAIAAGDARANAAKDAAAQLHAELEATDKQRRARESGAQDEAAKRDKLQAQSAVVKTNKEYTTLLHEIDAQQKRIGEIEDDILVAMEKIDSVGGELRGAETGARQVA